MKKNLIAMAVAAAASVPFVASAEDAITVYGLAQVEVGNVDPQASGQDSYVTETDNANGRVGVAATEDLGGGLKGLAKFEFRIDTADGAASSGVALTGRELFVGLAGGFGQAELGRLKSAYKYAGGVAYDPFVATLLEARTKGKGMSGGDFGQGGFLSNHIGYSSPKLGPVDFRVTYGPSTDDSSYTADVKASFKMGEVFVAFADEGDRMLVKSATTSATTGITTTNTYKDYSAVKVGGQLKFAGGAHKISAQYEMLDTKVVTTNDANSNTSTSSPKPKYFFIGYQGNFGKSTFVAQLGSSDQDVTDGEATYFALGAFYNFSKETSVYGGYKNTDQKDKKGESVITIGLRKTFK
jgi:predicted porin